MAYYGSVSGFRVYHTTRGRDFVSYLDPAVEIAMQIATEWIDVKYRSLFPGLKVGQRAQEREWPREGGQDIYGYAISASVVPNEVINATYEAAAKELVTSGTLTKDYTPNQYKRATVDGAVSVEYRQFASAHEAQTMFLIVDQILDPILTGQGKGSFSPLSGAASRV